MTEQSFPEIALALTDPQEYNARVNSYIDCRVEERVSQILHEYFTDEYLNRLKNSRQVPEFCEENILDLKTTEELMDEMSRQETVSDVTAEEPQKQQCQFDADAIQQLVSEFYMKFWGNTEMTDYDVRQLQKRIGEISSKRVWVKVRQTKTKRVTVNWRNTPEVLALFDGKRWNGLILEDQIAETLTRAFPLVSAEVSETSACEPPATEEKKKSWTRVRKCSKMMRIHRQTPDGDLAPMVIDPDFGHNISDMQFTHVRLMKGTRDKNALYMVFSHDKPQLKNAADRKNTSTIRPYGVGKDKKPTTYVIGSNDLQNSILKHFHTSCAGMEEKFFRFNVKSVTNEKCVIRLENINEQL